MQVDEKKKKENADVNVGKKEVTTHFFSVCLKRKINKSEIRGFLYK